MTTQTNNQRARRTAIRPTIQSGVARIGGIISSIIGSYSHHVIPNTAVINSSRFINQ